MDVMPDNSQYDVNALINDIKNGFKPTYLFFWGHQPRRDGQIGKQCLSQWWPSPFSIENITYPTVEHYLMAEKARLFRDEVTWEKILAASSPAEAKNLGRRVIRFDEVTWSHQRFDIAVQGNEAKFSQNDELRRYLQGSGERILVEASPDDAIWGIGLSASDPEATNPVHWRGLNLLGFALMEVRCKLNDLLSPA
jgi:ribA/ribD-fused uncharacterized protein